MNMWQSFLLFVLAATMAGLAFAAESSPLPVVASVDLVKYAGKWHELARLPNRFQRACASDVTASYILRPDGKIEVLNQCRRSDGKIMSAKGTARVASKDGPNSKLKVSFFWPFSGNYWIIDLDSEYQWAVVGEPGRSYLWVLSRSETMNAQLLQQILDRAKQQGFDTSKIIFSKPPSSSD